MLTLTLTALASFAAGIGVAWLWNVASDYLTEGREAYLAFINAMEDPE